ncbi:hydroxymethylbilane synthase [Kitasatospora sp. NBC_01287]|uniref:hydroxymethylbilane synthase n=1 Tax=Kitasatospora sp. NBC_01287 TaxID=2903573 RepID=UPI00224EDF82|nr:hydroxymethylbilane synthase [Kitasatospora sp. NBC_01287]MCX4749153.1 hydroxymethylbilane synthase [Kitasatospora sp. NBC_01287]
MRFVHRPLLEGGDKDRRSALASVSQRSGGSAFSTNQETALLAGDVDLVVHSLKDLPTANPPGLVLLAPPAREDVSDALCGSTLADLPEGATVGTGAARRIAQLLAVRPDLTPVPIRGNVPPRLAKAKARGGTLDAVLLAAAGLRRLDLDDAISQLLPLEAFPPSAGQGALGIQIREEHTEIRDLLAGTGCADTWAQVRAERAMLAELHGGCSVPVGAWATTPGTGVLTLLGQVTTLDGSRQITATVTGPVGQPEHLGRRVAAELLDRGAEDILRQVRPSVAVG